MQLSGTAELAIRDFQKGDEEIFRRLNESWISRYFDLEKSDEVVLNDPRRNILDAGGRIFLAVLHNEIVGCCALLRTKADEFEVAKMAVAEVNQGTGIGRKLLERAISEARASGAVRLSLESNRKLSPALRLYESLGFRHVPVERLHPSPYARADVYLELFL